MAPGKAAYESFHFEDRQRRQDTGVVEGRGPENFVDRAGVCGNESQDFTFLIVEAQLAGREDGASVGGSNRMRQWTERFEDVVGVPHQRGTVANQVVATFAGRTVEPAGNNEYLSALLERMACGVESAAVAGRLDDKHSKAQPGDDAIALREQSGDGCLVQAGFAQQRTGSDDFVGQFGVLVRIDVLDARSEDGDRPASALNRTAVGTGVDATGETGDDRHASRCEVPGKSLGLLPSVQRAAARADDGQAEAVRVQQFAAEVQKLRRVGNVSQEVGIARVTQEEQFDAEIAALIEFAFRVIGVPAFQDRLGQLRPNAGGLQQLFARGPEHVGGRSKAIPQRRLRLRTDAGNEREPQ